MKVRYTEPAAEELEAIITYFRDIAPSVVADFADSVDNAVSSLVDNPHMAQETEKQGAPLVPSPFSIFHFFTVEGDELVILHIHHAARRWPWEMQEG